MEEKSKYARQAAYNRRTYVRFPLDLKPEVLEAFKAKCAEKQTTPTTEIKRMIDCVNKEEPYLDYRTMNVSFQNEKFEIRAALPHSNCTDIHLLDGTVIHSGARIPAIRLRDGFKCCLVWKEENCSESKFDIRCPDGVALPQWVPASCYPMKDEAEE